jgi:hypothetical protein
VPLLVLVSMPFIQAISHGQNTFTSLLLLCATVTAWRARRAVLAGAICALLFYKPQHGALLAALLTMSLGRRTLIGLGSVLGALLLITLVTMPGAASDWLHQLPINVHYMQVENTYNWERHATLKSFWRMLLQGRGPGEALPLVTTLTVALGAVAVVGLLTALKHSHEPMIDNCWTGETRAVRLDRLIAATIAATPLVMPFYFDYDLLLLAVPAVLFGGEMMSHAPGRPRLMPDRRLVHCWCVLFAILLVNSPLARVLGVGVIVPPLAAVTALLIKRAYRRPLRDPSTVRVAEEIRVLLQVRKAA